MQNKTPPPTYKHICKLEITLRDQVQILIYSLLSTLVLTSLTTESMKTPAPGSTNEANHPVQRTLFCNHNYIQWRIQGGGGGGGDRWCPDPPSDPTMKKLSINTINECN